MLRALIYLRLTSLQNWFLKRLRSLRQPKQLIGAIAFGGYFWFFFLRHWTRGSSGVRAPSPVATAHLLDGTPAALPGNLFAAATAVGTLALFVFITFMWIVPTQRAALGFTEAEIAFLFPAPITRRALVHFRLLSAQFRSLIGAVVMTLLSNRWSFLGGNALTHAFGWWFIFSTLNLHFSGANFTLTRLSDAGFGATRRRILTFLLVAVVLAVTAWRLPAAMRLPVLDDSSVLRPFTDWITTVTAATPLGWVLWPFKLVVGPFLAPDLRGFFLTLGPALAVILLHYLWVVHSAVAFEESSIDYAQKRTARIAAWRSGQGRLGGAPTKARAEPYRLAGIGRPELAFLWKNLLSTWPYFTFRVLLGCAAVIIIAMSWMRSHPIWNGALPVVGMVAGFIGLYLLIIGPQFARQDIRSDLANADILKTYPLSGWQIVLGEMLTPVAILSGVLWLALLTFALAFSSTNPAWAWLTPQVRIACGLGLALIVPLLASLQLLVPNAAALVFPAWFQASRFRGGGPEVAGQRMIFFFAQVLTMALALAPPAGFAALLIFILQSFVGPMIAICVAGAVVTATLVGEVWCGLWLLGQRFEKFDLSAELRS
jgi:ABC-2 type transport system permease protein